jgi:hypothetical protein
MNTKPNAPTKTVTAYARLNPDVYAALERECQIPPVSRETTAVQTAYAMGIEHVLRKLRQGYVVG